MASISVPIERYKHQDGFGMMDHHSNHQNSFGYGHGGHGGPGGPGGPGGYRSHGNMSRDNGPPYIVKLLNLPLTANGEFVDDLFKSRYTPYIKFKIVVDPSSNILETNIVKKIAFVELQNFQDLSKVLKWQDLYYRPGKRVVIEMADFIDFQYVMDFNKTHEDQIAQIESDFLAGKFKSDSPAKRFQDINGPPRSLGPHGPLGSHRPPQGPPLGGPLPQLNGPILERPQPKPKSNPFGAAKPVDVASKQHEIEKKLITINHTTVKTLSLDDEPGDNAKEQSSSSQHSGSQPQPQSPHPPHPQTNFRSQPSDKESKSSGLRPAPLPEPRQAGLSYAELLSNKPEESPTPNKNSPKPKILKPVILKKKQSTPTNLSEPVDLSIKESEVLNQKEAEEQTAKLQTTKEPEFISKDKDESANEVTEKLETVELLDNSSKPNKLNVQELKEDRPDFKKHFDELTKKPFVPKDKSEKKPHLHNNESNGHNGTHGTHGYNGHNGSHRGAHRGSHRGHGNNHRGHFHNYNQSYLRDHSRNKSQDIKSPSNGSSPKSQESQLEKHPEHPESKKNEEVKSQPPRNKEKEPPKSNQDSKVSNFDDKLLSGDDKVTRAIENSSKERFKMSSRGRKNSRFQNTFKRNSSPKKETGNGLGSEPKNEESKPQGEPEDIKPQVESSSSTVSSGSPEVTKNKDQEIVDEMKHDNTEDKVDTDNKVVTGKERGRGSSRGRYTSRGRGRGMTRGRYRSRGDFNLRYVRKHNDEGGSNKPSLTETQPESSSSKGTEAQS